jgi:hypothetical protein
LLRFEIDLLETPMSKTSISPYASALPALAWSALAILMAWGPGAGPAAGQPRQGEAKFATATEEAPFRRVAETFVTTAATGNRHRLADMLSPTVVTRTGAEAVERFLVGEVLPFFAPYKELAHSVSVTRTADVRGFVFYMYMASATDELRPFAIYVIEEGGAKVVANVLVDRLVEGRHCIKVSTGWRCPDFG